MTLGKRLFDVIVALLLAILLIPIIAGVALLILIRDGRPVFFLSERMKTPGEGFYLWKFRTMKPDPKDSGVTGKDKSDRITKTGHVLRRHRLDELPQLWNILRGDISFVGPRPPLRRYVDAFPETYEKVLKNRPGVTGLATVVFHKHEERLLSDSQSGEETDAIYCRRCIPRKARLDLIYQARRTLWLDIALMLRTAHFDAPLHHRAPNTRRRGKATLRKG